MQFWGWGWMALLDLGLRWIPTTTFLLCLWWPLWRRGSTRQVSAIFIFWNLISPNLNKENLPCVHSLLIQVAFKQILKTKMAKNSSAEVVLQCCWKILGKFLTTKMYRLGNAQCKIFENEQLVFPIDLSQILHLELPTR